MTYKVKTVTSPHDISAVVPGSKSITNRALLIAALAEGKSVLKGCLFSDDSRHFIEALVQLGFPVEVDEEKREVAITGFGGKIPKKEATIDVGSAGTAARFLTALLGLSKGKYNIISSDQMKKRPMQELLQSLESMGAEIDYWEKEYHFPFTIGNSGHYAGSVEINVDRSSQFLSALLISAMVMKKDFEITVTGTHGMAYVEMTVRMMQQFGIKVDRASSASVYTISADSAYNSMSYEIEPDISAACYFYAMSPLLSVKSQVCGVHRTCIQGDIAFLDVLSDMGCTLEENEQGIICIPPESGRIKGGKWNLSAFSDQALTLAAVAPFADSDVEIDGIQHISFQECDRINAIIVNLTNMGVSVEKTASGVKIFSGKTDIHSECQIQTFEDHRVAMSFTLPGLVLDGVQIQNPYCCRKTFEDFYEVLEKTVY